MKQSLTLLAAAFMLSGVTTAFGASSVDLTVKGLITPSACTPTLSNDGVVDYGKISAQDLTNRNVTPLPVMPLKLMVNCAAATLIGVKSADNRPGTAYELTPGFQPNFGLGLAAGGKKIGWYVLTTANATGDGSPHSIIESFDGNSWTDVWDEVWQIGWLRALKAPAGGGAAPLPVQKLELDLKVLTSIAPRVTLPVTADIVMDGSATLEVVYL